MPWVRFEKNFDFRPTRQAIIAYKAGQSLLVSQECADQAIKAGAAVAISRKEQPFEGPQLGKARI